MISISTISGIQVTIGRQSCHYNAFVTTAPAALDAPSTFTLYAGSLREVVGFAIDPIALDDARARTPSRLILIDATELSWQRARCRTRAHRSRPPTRYWSGSTRSSSGYGSGSEHIPRPKCMREIADSGVSDRRRYVHDQHQDSRERGSSGHPEQIGRCGNPLHRRRARWVKAGGIRYLAGQGRQWPERELPLATVLSAWGTPELFAPAMDREAGGARPLGRSRSAGVHPTPKAGRRELEVTGRAALARSGDVNVVAGAMHVAPAVRIEGRGEVMRVRSIQNRADRQALRTDQRVASSFSGAALSEDEAARIFGHEPRVAEEVANSAVPNRDGRATLHPMRGASHRVTRRGSRRLATTALRNRRCAERQSSNEIPPRLSGSQEGDHRNRHHQDASTRA